MTQNERHGASGERTPHRAERSGKEELIARQLRQVYGQVADEPIPERFLDLLKQIEEQEGRAGR
ncbi:NepR family anti-sigma factor [Futiania mangrovi]|uniref:Anti-sigma factor NepR domain-containing protein n=1 Tax=Futiania mangrovi TaxID=2959716 RepID=A0A9J6PDD5_9PROT|nr:NepR family anti-sigma factor [Futiania mangrovii]MCP1336358.1 hypothetical protein [Futiania mangrovii]